MTATAALALALIAPLEPAAARPAVQHVISRGAAERTCAPQAAYAGPRNDRMLYGRIETIRGNALEVRSRTGRLLRVDASDAVRSGTYSAPLFVGKLVLITGYYDAAQTLHAQTITRQARLNAQSGADR